MKWIPQRLLKSMCMLNIVILLVMASGCSFFPDDEEELEPPQMEPVTIKYTTKPAARGTLIQQIELSAVFTAQTQISLSFEQSGLLKEKSVQVGKQVKAGDLIGVLDSSDLAFQILIQELEIEKHKLTISQLRDVKAGEYAIQTAMIDLKQQELQLDRLNAKMAATKIFAPIDGEITYVTSIAAGENINADQIVVKIADLSSLILVTKSGDASKLPIGAKVTIILNYLEYEGEVVANPSSLSNDPNESLHQAAILSISDELRRKAAFGDVARVIYVQDIRKDVIMVSRRNIHAVNSQYYVNVLEDGMRVEKDVEIGLVTDTDAEIVSGLEEGDLVIVN
jgi:RND family efflux transporter MFP subunit